MSSALQYVITGRKRGSRQRFQLTEPADLQTTHELEPSVAKAALKAFANIRTNRYRKDKPLPYYDITELYSRKGGGEA